MKLVVLFFALAQCQPYEYEYYDPTTGATLGPAAAGVPVTPAPITSSFSAPFSTPSAFGSAPAPFPSYSSAPAAPAFGSAFPAQAAPAFGSAFPSSAVPAYGSTTFSSAPASFPSTYPAVFAYSSTSLPSAYPAVSAYSSASLPSAYPAVSTYSSASLPSAYPAISASGSAFSPVAAGPAVSAYSSTAPTYGSAFSAAPAAVTPVGPAVSTSYGSAVPVQATIGANGAVTVNGVTAVPVGTAADGRPIYRVVDGDASSLAGISGQQQQQQQQLSPELEALKARAERQAQIRKRNTRAVKQASNTQAQLNLYDSILSPDVHSEGFGLLRLQQQKKTIDALRSESRIATSNARIAYQRYLQEPSRINLLVSKYADLNAELHDQSVDFNTVNSVTFGQSLSRSGGLFGGIDLTSVVVQLKERDSLEETQRRMNRIAKQISAEVQRQQGGGAATLQGSASQRLVAGTQYGPPRYG